MEAPKGGMKYSEELFTYLVGKYADMVYRISFAKLHNRHDAEDISQEVFEKLFIYLNKQDYFQSEDHIRGWLAKVASNGGVSKLRKIFRSKTISLDEETLPAEKDREEIGLADCIAGLDKKYSTVIYLFYYERFSLEEIAKLLSLNLSTVKTRLRRGKEALKKMLEPEN